MLDLDLLDIILIVVFLALFGGAILRIGGYVVYALLIIVSIVFLLRVLGVLI